MSDYCSDLSKLANKVKPLVTKARTVAAVAATVGALSQATGTTWGYNEDTNEFYEMTPMSDDKTTMTPTYITRESDYGGEYVNANIIDAWEALMSSGIPERKYSEGELPSIEGTAKDKTEYICQNYAMDATNYLNNIKDENGNQKFHATAILIAGTDTYGNAIGHAAIKIEDRTNAIAYWIDPSAGVWSEKEETQLSSMQKWIKDPRSYVPFATTRIPITTQVEFAGTIIEPQTGQTGETGYDITGTQMMLGETQYTIEHIEELPNAIQIQAYSPDEGKIYGQMTSIGKGRTVYDAQGKQVKIVQENIKKRGGTTEQIELAEKDLAATTVKQTPEIEKENALIRLNAMKNTKPVKSIEELKKMNPMKSTTNQYNKKTTGEIIPPIELTDEDIKQMKEIENEIKMWTGE